MGFLNLQMIQWIFQLMGNHISCMHLSTPEMAVEAKKKPSASPSPSPSPSQLRTIKLIKSDGIVKIYNRPINASELMLEFPKHLVCHSDSFYIGKKIPPLSENDKLQLGQKYFLLPTHFFQSVLSFVTIASSFAANNNNNSSKNNNASCFLNKAAGGKNSSCQQLLPFDIQKTPSGSLQIRVSDEFISNLLMEGEEEEEEDQKLNKVHDQQKDDEDYNDHDSKNRSSSSSISSNINLCTTPQLQKDYKQLVGSNRQWKPKLDSIKESSRMRKLGSFGIKIRSLRNKSDNDDDDDDDKEIISQKKKQKKKNTQRPSSEVVAANLQHSTSSIPCRSLHQIQSITSRSSSN